MSPAATNPKAGWEVPFKYVVELARGSVPGVHHVYLLARQVLSLDVDWSYVESTDMLAFENSVDPCMI